MSIESTRSISCSTLRRTARLARAGIALAAIGFVLGAPATAAAQAPAAQTQVDPSQVEIWDVIQTTDGNVLKGVIVEQSRVGSGTVYKLVLPGGGGTMTIPDSKVTRITKERNPARVQPAAAAAYPPPGAAPQQAPAAGYPPGAAPPPPGGYPPAAAQGAPPGYGYDQQGAPPGYAQPQQPGAPVGYGAAAAAPAPSDPHKINLPPPIAVPGLRLGAQIGLYFPMGDLADNANVGFGGRVRFGYEFMFGRIGLTPSLALELASFSGDNFLNDSSVFYLGVQPGITAAVHMGMFAPYLGMTFGFDRYAVSGAAVDNAPPGTDTDATGFGFGVLFGLDFVFTPSVSAGIGAELHPGFTSYDPGGIPSQDLGHAALLLEGKYHF